MHMSETPGGGTSHLGQWVDLYEREWGAKAYRGFTHDEWLELRAAILAEYTPQALTEARVALAKHRLEHPPQQGTLLPNSLVCNDHRWHILETRVAILERGRRYAESRQAVRDSDDRRIFGRVR